MKRNRISHICQHCAIVFETKASQKGLYCSVPCKNAAIRTRPEDNPRPCECCGTIFKPSRKRGDARFCSKSCIWKVTRGPEFNRRIGREYADKIGDAQRHRGDGKGYVKRRGRHEHRIVAEESLGRALLSTEVVHHIDGNKQNNDPTNLAVMTQGEHMREHGLGIPGAPLAHEPWKLTRHYRGGR
jgi:uncharacterized C2H2 Zn-finger protein